MSVREATPPPPRVERLIIAVTDVLNSTRACRERGDDAMFAVLRDYYAAVASAIEPANGRVIKVIGDSVLMAFTIDRAADVMASLRRAREESDRIWKNFHSECAVRMRVHAGEVRSGMLGPPHDERFDIVGDTVNALFKYPPGDFVLTPESAALLRGPDS